MNRRAFKTLERGQVPRSPSAIIGRCWSAGRSNGRREVVLYRSRTGLAILLAVFWACASAQPHGDACQAQIPRTLSNALAPAFPGYRTPLEYGHAAEAIKYSESRGGIGCLGVAAVDFIGDGKKDYLIGLTAVK